VLVSCYSCTLVRPAGVGETRSSHNIWTSSQNNISSIHLITCTGQITVRCRGRNPSPVSNQPAWINLVVGEILQVHALIKSCQTKISEIWELMAHNRVAKRTKNSLFWHWIHIRTLPNMWSMNRGQQSRHIDLLRLLPCSLNLSYYYLISWSIMKNII